MKLAPVRLSPIFVPRIWGRRELAPLFPAMPRSGEPIGEVWLTGESCKVLTAEGGLPGGSLGEIWPSLSEAWTGHRCRQTPRIQLLVKFIFPEDKLSVQVHPGDSYAREHEAAAGGVGKTEMWYAVSARAGAELRLGLEQGVTRETFSRAIADGSVEACLRRFEVRAGDAFFVPAGTAHTIGPGMVLCEVQQHSDLTYRVFDYNRLGSDGRPRPLHIRQALEVMDFAGGEAAGGRTQPVKLRRGPLEIAYLAACRYFVVERWSFSEAVQSATSADCFELVVLLAGSGWIESGTDRQPYSPAEAWLLPAALGGYRLVPEEPTYLLRTYVPDLEEFSKSLANQKVDEEALARLVHL